MPIQFCEEKTIEFEKIFPLYVNAGWTNYTSNPSKLERALCNSLYLLTARSGDQLVGLLRAVGDGFTIIFIQDIIVLNSFQRQGIGSELIKTTLDKFKDVRQILLLTDEKPDTIAFYKSAGLRPVKDLKLISFIKINDFNVQC